MLSSAKANNLAFSLGSVAPPLEGGLIGSPELG